MSSIEKLQPADNADILMYKPYYQDSQLEILSYALSLYQQGFLEGSRVIEGDGKNNIPFIATWYVSSLPDEKTRCRIQFDKSAELSYEVNLKNSEFISYLIDLIKKFKESRQTDFSQKFYRKLLSLDDDTSTEENL